MPDGRPDLVTLHHTFGTLAREFGARRAGGQDAAGRDPRLQLGQALERLYAALDELRQGRPLALQQVWSDSPDATLVTPAADVVRGWDGIRTRLAADARGGAAVVAEDVDVTLCADAAWAVCTERETHPGRPAGDPAGGLRHSTNIFRRESGTWRLVHRHVSAAG